MRLSVLAADLADLLLPRTCPGCGAGQPWCARCARTVSRLRLVVPQDGFLQLWRQLLPSAPIIPVRALARYQGPARAAVLALKEKGRRDLARPLGTALGAGMAALVRAGALPETGLQLVPAPTRAAAARARGSDPVVALAKVAARTLAASGRLVGVTELLYTAAGAVDSVGLTPRQRIANLHRAIRCRPSPPLTGGVLIDDVFTTGATVACAARAMADAGHQLLAAATITSVAPHTHLPARSRVAR